MTRLLNAINALRTAGRTALAATLIASACGAQAALLTFAADTPANNSAVHASWLAATGTPSTANFVNFETGFVADQNVSGVAGVFSGGLVVTDSSAAGQAIVRSGAGVINGSNPIDRFALTHNEQAYLTLDFSSAPITYFGAYSIDQAGTTILIDFTDGTTDTFNIATTAASGNSAEFFGFVSQGARIQSIRFDANGDGRWGLDDMSYGTVPEPGSLALVGFAGLALALARRRSKASRS